MDSLLTKTLWSYDRVSQRRIVFYTDNGVCQYDNILISMKEIDIKSLMKPLPFQHDDWVFVIETTGFFFFLHTTKHCYKKLQKWNLRFDHCIDKKSGYLTFTFAFILDGCIKTIWY